MVSLLTVQLVMVPLFTVPLVTAKKGITVLVQVHLPLGEEGGRGARRVSLQKVSLHGAVSGQTWGGDRQLRRQRRLLERDAGLHRGQRLPPQMSPQRAQRLDLLLIAVIAVVMTYNCFLLKKWGPFFVYFRLFKQIWQFIQQIYVKKCYDHPVYGTGIWTHDLQNMSLLP